MRLVSFGELKTLKGIGYSRVHLNRLVQAGAFPAPIPVGGNRVGWDEEEVDGWLEAKKAKRDGKRQEADHATAT